MGLDQVHKKKVGKVVGWLLTASTKIAFAGKIVFLHPTTSTQIASQVYNKILFSS